MLIAVEGCVGAGKSTVAAGLAEYRNSKVLLEAFESNPFLRAFYEDPVGSGIETEFAFLLLHYHQLKREAMCIETSEVVSDFHLGKDLLYADLNLHDAHVRRVFNDLYEVFRRDTPRPDLFIFLSATNDLLIERIRHRRRDFELEIDTAYYARVNSAYEEAFPRHEGRKIRLSMDDWDFVKRPSLFVELNQLVVEELGRP